MKSDNFILILMKLYPHTSRAPPPLPPPDPSSPPAGPPGFHTTARELQTRTFDGPGPSKTPPKFHEKTPRETQKERNGDGRGELKREMMGPHPSAPHSSGLPRFGPHLRSARGCGRAVPRRREPSQAPVKRCFHWGIRGRLHPWCGWRAGGWGPVRRRRRAERPLRTRRHRGRGSLAYRHWRHSSPPASAGRRRGGHGPEPGRRFPNSRTSGLLPRMATPRLNDDSFRNRKCRPVSKRKARDHDHISVTAPVPDRPDVACAHAWPHLRASGGFHLVGGAKSDRRARRCGGPWSWPES